MKRLCVLIFALLLLNGCLTVCRHKVLSDYAWAVEQGYKPEIVLYTTTQATRTLGLGIWNGHVQARANGKWIAYGTLNDDPEYPLGEYCWIMDLDRYIEYLHDYKNLSEEPYEPKPGWPRCAIIFEHSRDIQGIEGRFRWTTQMN